MEGVAVSLQAIKETNQKLDSLIEVVSHGSQSLSVTPDHMATLLAELLRAGEWLRAGLGNNSQDHMANELEGYCVRLEKLRHMLPPLQAQLLTERCRLAAEKDHLEATAAWARSARLQPR
jgi:hypothetical protein